MSRDDATRSLRYLDETLDPVLEAVGFAPAQISIPAPTAGTTYCAPLTTIRNHFPDLPDGHGDGYYSDVDRLCFDVTVQCRGDLLDIVWTDGGDLADSLEAIGHETDANRYRRLVGRPAADIREELTELVTTVFSPRTSEPIQPLG